MSVKQPLTILSRIQRRRNLVGTSREMYGHAAEILEGPQSKRFKAINATHPQYITDIKAKSGLCKQLDSDHYKQELYEIAMELGLDINKRTTKRELCERLSIYAKEAGDIPMPETESIEDSSKKLYKDNKMLQRSLRSQTPYSSKRERLQEYDSDVFDKEPQNYSRLCQPVARHPIVINGEELMDIVDELSKEIDDLRSTDWEKFQSKRDFLRYLLDEGSILYRNNHYLCPFAYCQNDNKLLNSHDEVSEHIDMGHTVFTQGDYKTPGFLPKDNSKGLCAPCCFARNSPALDQRRRQCMHR